MRLSQILSSNVFLKKASLRHRATKRKIGRVMLLEALERREVFNASYFSLASGDFSQNWNNTTLIGANDNWDNVPSIVGYLGDSDLVGAVTNVDPRTLTADIPAVLIDVIANQATPNTQTAGGVAEFEIADPVVALQGSGTADAPYLLLHLDTLGRGNINISYNLRDVDGAADNAVQQMNLQYRVGSSGPFTNVAAGYVADASSGPSLATLVTAISASLPAQVSNQAQVQIRIMTTNAAGSDEWIGVDDIVVTSTSFANVPDFSITLDSGSGLKVEGNSGTSPATSYTYTVTRGGDTSVEATVGWEIQEVASQTANAADFTGPISGTLTFPIGVTTQSITVNVIGDTNIELDETFRVALLNPTPVNSTTSVPSVLSIIANDDPSLQPGDVVITHVSTLPNPDRFSFVPLVDLVEGTTIRFTDNGWDGQLQALGTAEGTVSFIVGAGGLAKNTKVIVNLGSDQLSATVSPSVAGSASVQGTFALNGTGDSLIAYAGSSIQPQLLFAVNTNLDWAVSGAITNSITYLPDTLVEGFSAVAPLGGKAELPLTQVQEAAYNHILTYGTASELRDAVANAINWTADNDGLNGAINPINFTETALFNVIITESNGTTSVAESGVSDTYTVQLTSPPAAPVTITLTPDSQLSVNPTTLTFTSADWNTPQTVTVNAVQDTLVEGNHSGTISTSVTSSAPNYNNITVNNLTASISDDDTTLPSIFINEIDSDTPGTDVAEFIELYDGGVGNTSLTGLVIVLYNGANDLSYGAFDLDGFTTNASGYFLLGNAGVLGASITFADNFLQNGADAVAIYAGDATSFPNGTPLTLTNVMDAVVYDTNDTDDAGLLTLITAGGQIDETGTATTDANAVARVPNGGTLRDSTSFVAQTPTPGASNIIVVTPTITATPLTKVYDSLAFSIVATADDGPGGAAPDTTGFTYTYYAGPGKTGGIIPAPKNVNVGGYSVDVAYAGNASYNAVASTVFDFTITPFGLTGSITAADKVFDGNTSATILTRTLATVFPGDTVSYDGGTATFDTAAVGTGKTVTATGLTLIGADAGNYTVNSTATTTASITAAGSVVNRRVFYNGGAGGATGFGASTNFAATGGNPPATAIDSKVALLPGQNSGFNNYTNTSFGLNGIIVDIANPIGTLTAADFSFAKGGTLSQPGFVPFTATELSTTILPVVTQFVGGGENGSTRAKITFNNNSLKNTWVKVTVLASGNSGLTADDVFYFGNVAGDVNGSITAGTRYTVNTLDTSAVRSPANQSTIANSVPVTNIYDFNKTGNVNSLDTSAVRGNQQTTGIVLVITGAPARGIAPPQAPLFSVPLFSAPAILAKSSTTETVPVFGSLSNDNIVQTVVLPPVASSTDAAVKDLFAQVTKLSTKSVPTESSQTVGSIDDFFAQLGNA